jgi:DNA-binding MarR family transcriptional regulator
MPEVPALISAVRALARLSRIVERASDGLSLADYRVMSAIMAGEARATRLAARLEVGKPTISATVDSLSRRGLVLRSSVKGDNRATALSLTESGLDVFARVEDRMAAQLGELCERTPDGPRAIETLSWLGDAIEDAMVARAAQTAQTAQLPQAEEAK